MNFKDKGYAWNCYLHLVLLAAFVFFIKLHRIEEHVVRYMFLSIKHLLGSSFWIIFVQLKIWSHQDQASYHHLLYQSQI